MNDKDFLEIMLAAPDSEIKAMIPTTIGGIVAYLKLPPTTPYESIIHYPMALAQARRQWASAMIKELNKLAFDGRRVL
jgi:hypothetical protein